ncbi:MAG: tetratricopeptide repeat protein, partial [Nitrospinaceae bacterium]|nr:tetratricopeptide repeat protein [Nitrospinaceae bacterium]
MRSVCLFLFPACLAVCGCKPDVAELDAVDVGQPLMKKAALKAEEGDLQSAVRLYQKVLDDNPDNARAHLDMALLLDDHLKDYVPGIYHYRRYLDLRGTAEKRAMIEERIRRAEQMFAAGILMPSKRADRVTALERENRLLRVKLGAAARRLEKLEEEVARNRQAAA